MSKRYMAEIAKMMGVELRQPFKIADFTYKGECNHWSGHFRLTEDGIESSRDNIDWFPDRLLALDYLIEGIMHIAPYWKPKDGELYYIPTVSNKFGYQERYWANNDCDKFYYDRLLVCKTKDEVKKLANKMLVAVGNERGR